MKRENIIPTSTRKCPEILQNYFKSEVLLWLSSSLMIHSKQIFLLAMLMYRSLHYSKHIVLIKCIKRIIYFTCNFVLWRREKCESLFLFTRILDWTFTCQLLCHKKVGTAALIMINEYSQKTLTVDNLSQLIGNEIETEISKIPKINLLKVLTDSSKVK